MEILSQFGNSDIAVDHRFVNGVASVHPGLHHVCVLPKQEGIDHRAWKCMRMTIRKRLVFAVALLGLSGLGGCGLYKWQKPGADDAAFKADSTACQQIRNPDGFAPCMQQRGWTLN